MADRPGVKAADRGRHGGWAGAGHSCFAGSSRQPTLHWPRAGSRTAAARKGPSPLFAAALSDNDQLIRKVLVFAAALAGLGVLAKRLGPKMQKIDWAKKFARMPDNAKPKWMFRNITAIRENTDRILELLEPDGSGPAAE